MKFPRRLASLVVLLALLASSVPLPAFAGSPPGTITVTTFNDDATPGNGTCSLREAVMAASTHTAVDACPAGTTVALGAGTYHLFVKAGATGAGATGALQISGNVTINGAAAAQTSIDATGLGDRIVTVNSKGSLTLSGVTLRGGNASTDGGAISNSGTLTLNNAVVTANHAGGNGGGILNSGGTLQLNSTLVSQNSAGVNGGGIAVTNGVVTIAASAILGNQAGSGSSSGNGGGLYITRGGLVNITDTTIAKNGATGNGGGLASTPEASPKATSKLNTANLVNVTVVANNAQVGGGIDNFGVTSLFNTILAGNSAPSAADCHAVSGHAITSQGYNLIQATGSCALSGTLTGNITGKDPELGPLANYGGATPSYRPNLGSPVVNAGSNTGCPEADQRGVARPGSGTGKPICDIGAVELSVGVSALVSDANTNWPHALEIQTGTPISTDALDQPGQSRWYKFHVDPSEQVNVTLTNLPANYDLTLYKDIKAAYLVSQSVSSTGDLAQLGAEFAPDAFSPDAFSPDAFSPDAFSPDAYSPDAYSPDAFSPDAYTPDAFSPDAFSPDAFSPDAFSPDAFSPDAFSPDAFSPDAFSPDAFSPDAYSSAQTRSIIGVSAFNGTAGEGIVVNTWDLSGDFYIRVRGRNGADDPGVNFTVQANVTSVGCSTVDWNAVNNLPSAAPVVSTSGKQTIILADFARMSAQPKNAPGDLATMQSKLNAFAALPSVDGVVVDVGQDTRVAAANKLADATTTCPYLKNIVAASVERIVDAYRAGNPLQSVVIVGDDDVIPFFRYPDQALLGSEQNYVPPVKDSSASQASIKLNYVLSQDRYGTGINLSTGNTTLPIPKLAVGRLVETMAEVDTMLDAYGRTSGGVITPSSALVTGYDFLADDARAVKNELANGLGAGGKLDSLITNDGVAPSTPRVGAWDPTQPWTASDLSPLLLNQRHDLVFLAGHFSAGSALAADFSTRILSTDLTASTTDLTNEIIFSVGCHSGYNTVNAADTVVTPEPDWAEAAATKGITLIAGTGYQYGDTDFIKYSEQIYLNFATQLRSGSGPVSLGQALLLAKQQYLTQAPPSSLSGTSVKAYLEATLFGLPMLSVNMPGARLQTQGSLQALANSAVQNFSGNPGAALGLSYQDVALNPTLTQNSVTLKDAGGTSYTATYYSGPDGVVVSPLAPVLPFVSQSAGSPDSSTIVRGVGFFGGSYTDLPNTRPLTSAVVTEQSSTHLPFHSSYLYPAQPWSLNYLGYLGGFSPPLLQVTPAQYQSNSATSDTGTLRLLNQMNFRLFFSGNTATYPAGGTYPTSGDIPALAAAPAISQVLATQGTDSSGNPAINFAAHVTGDLVAGIQEVWVTYTVIPAGGGQGQWISLDLTQSSADSTLWQGSLSLAQLQQQLGTQDLSGFRFMAQAANGVGLVTLATNLGAYYQVGNGNPPNPTATTLSFNAPPSNGTYGQTATFNATLSSSNAACVANQTLFFGIGAQRVPAQTDGSGHASATLPLLGSPGADSVRVTYGGSDACQLSSASTPFTINKQASTLTVSTSDGGQPIVARLTDASGKPLRQLSLYIAITGSSVNQGQVVTTDQTGTASLDNLDLPAGSYTVTATFGSPVTLPDNSTLDLTNLLYLGSSATASLGGSGPTGGGALAWGRNNEGELGNGSTTDSSLPKPVTTPAGVVALAAGDTYTIALRSDGTVWAWGNNGNHYLGDGTATSSTTPVQVQNLSNIIAISARRDHSLALQSDGTVWAWGENGSGQLGDGTTKQPATPVQVRGLPSNIVAVSAGGFFSMALTQDGKIYTWGANEAGQLGQNTSDQNAHSTPALVQSPAGVTFSLITSGFHHALAVDQNGNLWSWGGNENGTLGNGGADTQAHPLPAPVPGLAHVTAIAAYYNHSLAVSGGTVYAWGNNNAGELGDGTQNAHYTPNPVPGLTNVTSVAVGGYHSLALTADGDMYAWGSNSEDGRIGNNQTGTDLLSPIHVLDPAGTAPLTGITKIAAGDRFSLAIQGGTQTTTTLAPTKLSVAVAAPDPSAPTSNPQSVTATLTDNSGHPLANKNVLIFVGQTGTDAPRNLSGVATTDNTGTATLDISSLLPGSYTVQAFFGDERNQNDPSGEIGGDVSIADLSDPGYAASQSETQTFNMALFHTVATGLATTSGDNPLTVDIPADAVTASSERPLGGDQSNYMLSGDFDVLLDFNLVTWPSQSGVRMGIQILSLPGSVERTSYGPNDVDQAGEWYVTNLGDGLPIIPANQTVGKLRVTRSGSLISGYYWDGSNWQLIHQFDAGFSGDTVFGFAAWSETFYFTGQHVQVQLSNFTINSGTLVPINSAPSY